MQTKKRLRLKKTVIFKTIAIISILMTLWLFIMFVKLNVLPIKYLFLLFVILSIVDVFLYFALSKKSSNWRMVGTFLSVTVFIICFIGINYQNVTFNFLHQITFLNIETENYQLIVKNDSNYNSINDLKGKNIAFTKNKDGALKAFEEILKEEELGKTEIDSASQLVENLLNGEEEAILLESSEEELYSEMLKEFKENHKTLKTISVEVQKEDFSKDVKITQQPFSVYVTGVDTYDGISSVARSDVNMIVTINPVTNKILLTSIPRDYYVPIYNDTSGLNDKLTHAGLKGVETSVKTIENLLEMDINYYAKFNFTSLIQIVDAVGGIEVDSPFAFTADYKEETHIYYEFQKGINKLDGKMALAYVRERYGLREGDVARARHQQQVISALVNKLSTGTILTKYGELIGSMEGNFVTNIDIDSITSFVKMQLDKMPSWTIETQVLKGSDASMKTASMPDLYSSVMLPDEESVKEAIAKIDEIITNI